MRFLKIAVIILSCGFFIYYAVDDKPQAKIDNGIEGQKILIIEAKNVTYLKLWEFFGAHDDEVARETAKYSAEITARKKILREKINELDPDRLPAEDDAKKYEKYLTK